MSKSYWLYILSSNTGTLYVGMTDDLERRIYEHRNNLNPTSFPAKYQTDNLIYYEEFRTPDEAIEAEKRVKKWSRNKKINLVKSINPSMSDLSKSI